LDNLDTPAPMFRPAATKHSLLGKRLYSKHQSEEREEETDDSSYFKVKVSGVARVSITAAATANFYENGMANETPRATLTPTDQSMQKTSDTLNSKNRNWLSPVISPSKRAKTDQMQVVSCNALNKVHESFDLNVRKLSF